MTNFKPNSATKKNSLELKELKEENIVKQKTKKKKIDSKKSVKKKGFLSLIFTNLKKKLMVEIKKQKKLK
mgnify:CR=1 FL=1